MTHDTTRRLAEIKERAEKATEGPWEAHYYAGEWSLRGMRLFGINGYLGGMATNDTYGEANAKFVANARSDVPFLLAEIERLQGAHNSLARQISREAKSTGKLKEPKL